ncbi:MAG: enoyl-CoA hydratase/isomerase family protein [Bradyrhizobiaceae bacterium]|nr:MAG: enoyl-CoA hydratase/isomerase family protein [Bradyrhizobiaceae bacterium]
MTVGYELREGVAVLWLDDLARRNALSRAIVSRMFAALARSRDDNARAIVLAGRGPAFSAGANIDDLRDGWMEGREPDTDPTRLFQALTEEPRIVIAAVQGAALGGGFELTLACDLVLATPAAFFALPELGVGVIPNTAAARLQRIVGSRVALELILTRRRLTSAQAEKLGLVNKVVEASADVVGDAVALAAQIVSQSGPGAITAAKRAHHGHAPTDWERVRASLTEVPRAEWQEGLDAFTERRAPDFDRFWRPAKGG